MKIHVHSFISQNQRASALFSFVPKHIGTTTTVTGKSDHTSKLLFVINQLRYHHSQTPSLWKAVQSCDKPTRSATIFNNGCLRVSGRKVSARRCSGLWDSAANAHHPIKYKDDFRIKTAFYNWAEQSVCLQICVCKLPLGEGKCVRTAFYRLAVIFRI